MLTSHDPILIYLCITVEESWLKYLDKKRNFNTLR